MAQTAAMMMIYLFFTLFSLSFLPWTSTAFTMKLIHRDSPLSPLYQPNLSDLERFKKNIEISTARASYFQQQNELINSKARQNVSIRLPLTFHEPTFTVEIGIGTPAVKRTLIFDTGSGLTWTQCKPCIKCFKQNEPLFDTKKSSSYKTISKKHPLAKGFTCTPFGCVYRVGYYSGQITAGVAATENFTFHTNLGSPATVSNLVFGCGMTNLGNFPSEISGIIGFDKEPYSFVRQLGSAIKARFSYCMSAVTSNTKGSSYSYVRFGDEAVIRGRNTQRTPFLNYKQSSILYGLKLIDVSINGKKAELGDNAFPDGCFIDSGASVSLLNKRAFAAVKYFLGIYFGKFKNIRRYEGEKIPKAFVCYTQPEGFNSFPGMTFHFKGADYEVPPQNLFFFVQGNVFCLAMMESNGISILGAFQQRNVRVVYDLKERMLSFAPEDCSKDAPSL
ncbi:hypothetical protein C2S53_015215 [Perilla frutescens var. hirtella]|uniref:Peptidase A1 domain-containing protein n=1 Tax=Perilla frutescens var. hirtella TaxID=608512 RepID=A0AAD4NYF9_PERFH|nr:hypothetical protein C2S53_015215 [Perilla frutescens var. hirtella]